MRFTLPSAALSSRLSAISRVINSKNSLAILDSFLFNVNDGQLTITASDSENTITSTLSLTDSDSNGAFCINNRTILDAVKELSDQPLTFDVNMDTFEMSVSYMNGYFRFIGQNAEQYPQMQDAEGGSSSFTIDAAILVDNINRTIFATANDELRPVMNGIYFDLNNENLTIVASDGHKLVRNRNYSIQSEQPGAFILPKKPAVLLRSVLDKNSGDVTINFDNSLAQITFADGSMKCRLIEGRYPNYNSVIPQNNPSHLTVDRASLLSALKRVLVSASQSSSLVKFQIESGRILLTCEDSDYAKSAQETMHCEYDGPSMCIGFKGTSLIEILSNLQSSDVQFELADPSRAGIVTPSEQPENADILMLIMPMLLND